MSFDNVTSIPVDSIDNNVSFPEVISLSPSTLSVNSTALQPSASLQSSVQKVTEALRDLWYDIIPDSSFFSKEPKSLFDPGIILIDTGANVNHIRDLSAFERIDFYTSEINVAMNHGQVRMESEGVGILKAPFAGIAAHYVPTARNSLLSEAEISSRFKFIKVPSPDIPYNHLNDVLFLQDMTTEKSFRCRRCSQRLFVFDLYEAVSELETLPQSIVYNVVDVSTESKIVMAIDKDLKARLQRATLTKKEIKHMLLVEQLHKRSFVGLDILKKMLLNGTILGDVDGYTLTASDVDNYNIFIHSTHCLACIRGKTPEEAARPMSDISYACDTAVIDIANFSIESDKSKHLFLIAVDSKSQLVFQYPLVDQTAKTVLSALKKLRKDYALYKQTLRVVRFDGGKNFTSAKVLRKLYKLNIRVQVASPQRHARKAERAIRYIKNLARSTIADISFLFPVILVSYLIEWCVDSINFHLRSENDFIAPFTIFTGQPVSIQHMLRAKFLETVECLSVPVADSRDSTSKTFTGVVVARDRSFKGQLLILNLNQPSTNISEAKLLRRHQIHIVKPPDNLSDIMARFGTSCNLDDFIIDNEEDFEDASVNEDATWIDVSSVSTSISSASMDIADTSSDEEELSSTSFRNDKSSTWRVKDSDTFSEPLSLPPLDSNSSSSNKSASFASSAGGGSSKDSSDQMSLDDYSDESFVIKDLSSAKDNSMVHDSVLSDATPGKSSLKSNTTASSNNRHVHIDEFPTYAPSDSESSLDIGDFVLLSDIYRKSSRIPKPSQKALDLRRELNSRTRNKLSNSSRNEIQELIIQSTIREFTERFGAELTDDAVIKELRQMIDKRVWSFLTPAQLSTIRSSKAINIIPSMMLMKAKFDAFQELEKLKARLCACGNLQRFFGQVGIDFDLSAPTASATTLMLCLAIAAKMKMQLKTFDVSGAFLNAILPEEEFMRLNRHLASILVLRDPSLAQYLQPDGSMVVQLRKSIYGLRQAPKLWYETVSKVIIEKLNFIRSSEDQCLFFRHSKGSLELIVLYVDDFAVFSSKQETFDMIHSLLINEFDEVTKKEGDRTSFLGLQIARNPITNDFSVSLEGFIEKLEADFGESLDKIRASRPWSAHHLTSDTRFKPNSPIEDLHSQDPNICPSVIKEFRSQVMSAMYVAIKARPDVLVGITMLASKQLRPSDEDFHSIARIIKYLTLTKDKKLTFKSEGKLGLHCFCDASYERYVDSLGHGGMAIFLDKDSSSPFYWRSKKQTAQTSSPADAEALELAESLYRVRTLVKILNELKIECDSPVLYEDNDAIFETVNKDRIDTTLGSKRTNSSQFKVQEAVLANEVEVVWVSTSQQRADGLTKPLIGSDFENSTEFFFV